MTILNNDTTYCAIYALPHSSSAPVLLVGLFEDLRSPFWIGRQLVILEFPKITDWSLCWVIESDGHISTNPSVSTPQT